MELSISDPTFTRPARYGAFDRWALSLIHDERDLPFVHLIVRLLLTMPTSAALLFVPGVYRWWLALLYFSHMMWMMGPFILMLHNTSHRPLFKRRWMNHIIPWGIGPFFGETPETYYAHHMGMHHPENNLFDDLSTTMPYRRDSFRGFMHYFGVFFLFALRDLTRYMNRKNRPKLARRAQIGELSFLGLAVALCFVNLPAALTVFVLPFVVCRFMMMAGNWAQHAFVDASDPANPRRNSITCINAMYNKRCFNDGYHIGHHVKANRHWTEMPGDFLASVDEYAKDGAIVFHTLDFFLVWGLLMAKQYGVLAKYYVSLDGVERSKEEIVALFEARLDPIPRSAA